MNALPRRPPPKPWSMKWIVLAIVAFMAVYTVVNIYYRKAGRPYRPYQDAQDRATTARLLAAGWQKVALNTRRPIEKPTTDSAPAAVTRDFPGLGDLDTKFTEQPKLVATIDQVVAPGAITRGSDYALYFIASLPDLKAQVGDLTLFRRDKELVLIPTLETLPGKELKSRWNDSTYWLDFPTANLPPGRYEMRIVAKGPAAQWVFTVK